MKIIVDTRDQDPWLFPGIAVVRRALKFGDYALSGSEHLVAVERKACPDMAQSMTRSVDRLVAEFARAKQAGAKLFLVTEAPLFDVLAQVKFYFPNIESSRCLASFILKTGAVPIFAGTRQTAKSVALALLVKHSENSQ